MRKQIVEYTTPLDALIALVRELKTYEAAYQMESDEFFNYYCKGELSDEADFVEWAGTSEGSNLILRGIKPKPPRDQT